MSDEEIIQIICSHFKIKLTDLRLLSPEALQKHIDQSTGRKEDVTDSSFIIGADEIILGLYSDKNKRLASFFHELGHTLIHRKKYKAWPEQMSILYWEIQCWNVGFEYAFKHFGITFDEETIYWAYNKALSYYHYK